LSVVNKAINLAFYEAMDDAELINKEYEYYQNITAEDIKISSERIFSLNQCSTLLYKSKA
jgi:zinc protease